MFRKQDAWTVWPYRITSLGNGLAYDVEDKETGLNFLLQGDDAAQWRHEYEAAPNALAFLRESMQEYAL